MTHYIHMLIFPMDASLDASLFFQMWNIPMINSFSQFERMLFAIPGHSALKFVCFFTLRDYSHNQTSKKHMTTREMYVNDEFAFMQAILCGSSGNTFEWTALYAANAENLQEQVQPTFHVWAQRPKRLRILKTRGSDKAVCIPCTAIHQGGFKLV